MKYTIENTRIVIKCENEYEINFLEHWIARYKVVSWIKYEELYYIHIGYLPTLMKHHREIHIQELPNKIWSYAPLKYIPKDLPMLRNELQIDAVNFMSKHPVKSALVVQPGTGKTVMGIYQAIKFGGKTLIVCPNNNIRDQWISTLTTMFKIDPKYINVCKNINDIGIFGYDWILCLQQTISSGLRNDSENLINMLRNAKICTKIIDEAHLFFRGTLFLECMTNVEHSLYLTATFGRSSNEENELYTKLFESVPRFDTTKLSLMDRLFGKTYDIPIHVKLTSITTNSKLTKSQIVDITTVLYGIHQMKYANLVFPKDSISIFEYQIVPMIIEIIKNLEYGRVLILYPTIYACEKHCAILKTLIPNKTIGTMNSYNTRSDNTKVKNECDIIVSTSKSSGVGLDISDLSCVIACEQYNSPITSTQMHGRLRKRADGKPTFYYDFVDTVHSQLIKWGKNRIANMRRISSKTTFMDISDWYKTHRMNIKVPKNIMNMYDEFVEGIVSHVIPSMKHRINSSDMLTEIASLEDILMGVSGYAILGKSSNVSKHDTIYLGNHTIPFQPYNIQLCESIEDVTMIDHQYLPESIKYPIQIIEFGLSMN